MLQLVHPDVRPIEALVPRKAVAFGGKARGLATLARAGFDVPAGFAIAAGVAADAMTRSLAARDRLSALLVAPAREITNERLEGIAAAVRASAMAPDAERAIRQAFRALMERGASAVAVRSSAVDEDHAQRSGAGLYETRLGVRDEDALLQAIRDVWASAVSPRVIAYLRALGVRGGPNAGGVGVVVQALVPAEVAGVLFTVNPLSGDPQEIVVNAAYGLGSTVVDGRVSPDTYRIDKSTGWVRDRIRGDKAIALRVRGGELREEEVTPEDRAQDALPEPMLPRLAALAQRIERTFGEPRDVEWALVGRSLFVVQARPITAIRSRPTAPRRHARDRSRIVWSNVNVGEALPGVATPLTWSILSGFSDVGFRRAFGALGCRVPDDAELVGNFRGRIYLNLSDFFAIASQVPGISPRTILALGGGSDAPFEQVEGSSASGVSSLGFLARLPRTAVRFARENFALSKRVEAFERSFEQERRRLRALDLRLLSSTALHRVLLEVERLLDQSGQVLLNVYGNLLAAVVALRLVVQATSERSDGGCRSDALFREVLSGLLDVDSAGPGLELGRIAEIARRDPGARAYILRTPPERARLEDVPEGPTRALLLRFFELFGDRGTREAEIAEPRWNEDPTLPFATLRLHLLREDAPSPFEVERRQREVRERAQRELERRVPLPLRFGVRRLLESVQRLLRMRERLRAHVVTVLGLFRSIALDASRRMRAMEPGVGDDGAFFLSLEELHGVLRGDVPRVGDIVRARRLQFQRDVSLPDPPDTFVGLPPPIAMPGPEVEVLRGLGACAGKVEGTVRLLRDPQDAADFRPGEVLLAQRTDVGWSPLFLVASGIVTELGGPLSHASIVAREFGIPAVVNVKHATRVLSTGDRVELDGEAGTVRIIERR